MKRWVVNTTISLLIGGVFLWVAIRDWNWTDIGDSLRPLDAQRMWLSLKLEGAIAPGAVAVLRRGRDGIASVPLPAGPAAEGAETSIRVEARGVADPSGWWALELPTGVGVSGWSLDFRSPKHRAARERPGDPLVFAAQPGLKGRPGPLRLTGIAWAWLLPYILIFVLVHFARVYRWGILLRPLARLSPTRLYAVGSVGFMAILLLPLRLGEFVRPWLVTEDGASFSGALGTCVVERILDGLAVTGLLFGSIFLVAATGVQVPAVVYLGGYIALAVFASTLLVLVFARWKRDATLAFLERLGNVLSKGLTAKAIGLLRSFLDGLNALPNARLVAMIIAITIFYWSINIVGFWTLFKAVGLTTPAGHDLSLLQATAIMGILAIGIIIPAGPGFAGNFEVALRLGLSLFVTEQMLLTRGAAYIIVLHALQFMLQCGIGFAFLFSGQISLKRAISESARAAREV